MFRTFLLSRRDVTSVENGYAPHPERSGRNKLRTYGTHNEGYIRFSFYRCESPSAGSGHRLTGHMEANHVES